jgi:hypothetical protein
VHETLVKTPTEAGAVSEDQVVPALTVPMMTGLPKMPKPTAVQSDVVTQEMPFSPATPEGIVCGFQAWPALTDARTESTPTAKQSAVDGHDAELKRLVPVGGLCEVQETPPDVVLMMVDPVPRVPELPTATQSSAAEQEIPVISTALEGGVWSDQSSPLSEVVTTYGLELRLVPTAMQDVVVRGQTIAFSCFPLGSDAAPHEPPPLDVMSAAAPPFVAIPSAMQSRLDKQEILESDVTNGC